jgi:hypothetical protein
VVLSGDEMYEHDLAVEEEAVEAKETRRTEWKASLGDDSAEVSFFHLQRLLA